MTIQARSRRLHWINLTAPLFMDRPVPSIGPLVSLTKFSPATRLTRKTCLGSVATDLFSPTHHPAPPVLIQPVQKDRTDSVLVLCALSICLGSCAPSAKTRS